MTSIEAERTLISRLIDLTRGLRTGRSPELAERAAKREQALQKELDALSTAEATELPLNVIVDDAFPRAINFAKQPTPAKEGK